MTLSWINYFLFRLFTFPLQFLPFSMLHKLGRGLGLLVYYSYPKYRKRSLSNLSLATDLHLTPHEIVALAKKSLQSLAITALEYPRLYREKKISSIVRCENPEKANSLMQEGKGVIFFCGHQANWELLFLEGTSRMKGAAIGRPIRNKPLYRWTVRLREKFGGVIIPPKDAYRTAVKLLKAGKFLGIVGDQAMPESRFYSSFLGRKAWTSPLPALLSKRCESPIIVATIRREKGEYVIHYSDPIAPRENIESQMEEVLAVFQESIKARPSEWLWIHNKWKQQLPGRLKKEFRHDSIAFIFGLHTDPLSWLPELRKLYPKEQLTFFIPESVAPFLGHRDAVEVKTYRDQRDFLTPDYRFKLVINFSNSPSLSQHFKKWSALYTLHFSHPQEMIQHACQ